MNVSINLDVDVDIFEVLDAMSDADRNALLDHFINDDPIATQLEETARRIALAVSNQDGRELADLLHNLCMEHCGLPVTASIDIKTMQVTL